MKDSQNIRYARGQVEFALWERFRLVSSAAIEMPDVFRFRIRNLLDIDRKLSLPAAVGLSRQAFGGGSVGKGTNATYSASDAYALLLGLELTDQGQKQSEAVILLRHLRPTVDRIYLEIEACPYFGRSNTPMAEDPEGKKLIRKFGFATCRDRRGREIIDPSIFLMIRKVEFTELYPAFRPQDKSMPLIFQPDILRGTEKLREYIFNNYFSDRKWLCIELSEGVHILAEQLEKAPLKKRGR